MGKSGSIERPADSTRPSSISDAYRCIQREEASWRGRHISKQTGSTKTSEKFQQTFENRIKS